MTTQKLHLPSHPLYLTLHPLYRCLQNQCINCITPTLLWHYTLYVWHHIQYAWHHMNTLWHHTHIGMTSHPVYLWHHIQYIWSHPYCFMNTKRLYLAYHPLYLTSQPLHLCGHTCSSNAFTTIMEFFTLGTWRHNTHPTSQQIQTLWHLFSVFRTSQTLHSWHQISYPWHHIHGLWHLILYTCDITATILVT